VNPRPGVFHKLVHRLLISRPVSAFMARVLYRADAALLRLTKSRHTFTGFAGLPVTQLTTIGAKTGQPRTLPLMAVIDREKIALIASNFGRKHHPAWYYNLKAHPECKLQLNGMTETCLAHEAEGDEYERYWQLALSYYAGYEKYRVRAGRRIPVLVLEPKERS